MAGRLITVPAFAGARYGVQHFFGTRRRATGGSAEVGSATAGLPIGRGDAGDERRSGNGPVRRVLRRPVVVSVKQVHGTDALILDRPLETGETFAGGWDALITNQPGVLLTIRTADCVPVLVHDPLCRVVAAVHAGWRGAVAGIVPKTLSLMRHRFGSNPASLQVGIGPSVGPCCYEVDEPVLARLRAGFAEWRLVVRETGRSRAMLDLRAPVRHQALAAGVGSESIRTVRVCTACHPDLFYSYRRDGVVGETMVSGIMLTRRSREAAHSERRR